MSASKISKHLTLCYYIYKCNKVLLFGNQNTAKKLQDKILSKFGSEINVQSLGLSDNYFVNLRELRIYLQFLLILNKNKDSDNNYTRIKMNLFEYHFIDTANHISTVVIMVIMAFLILELYFSDYYTGTILLLLLSGCAAWVAYNRYSNYKIHKKNLPFLEFKKRLDITLPLIISVSLSIFLLITTTLHLTSEELYGQGMEFFKSNISEKVIDVFHQIEDRSYESKFSQKETSPKMPEFSKTPTSTELPETTKPTETPDSFEVTEEKNPGVLVTNKPHNRK